jgi:hypothetical protein
MMRKLTLGRSCREPRLSSLKAANNRKLMKMETLLARRMSWVGGLATLFVMTCSTRRSQGTQKWISSKIVKNWFWKPNQLRREAMRSPVVKSYDQMKLRLNKIGYQNNFLFYFFFPFCCLFSTAAYSCSNLRSISKAFRAFIRSYPLSPR